MKTVEDLRIDVAVRCLVRATELPGPADCFAIDDGQPHSPARIAGMILPREPLARARELLASGAAKVYLGEAALHDSSAVQRLSAEFGGARVGIYVPARRMDVSWSIDSISNADFKFMMPSVCEPCWEILDHAGARTGTHAGWWIGEMFALGASSALVQADLADDTDLNICAGLVERFGERLWIGPLGAAGGDIESWMREGTVRQLVLPAELYAGLEQAA